MRTWVKNMGKEYREAKAALRAAARKGRDSLPGAQRRESSQRVCWHLEAWQVFQEAGTVYFYYPLGSEVDLLPAARLALEQGKPVAFPRTAGEQMDFYQVGSLEDFKEGAFHVMEPVGECRMQAGHPLILVPGLAFDCHKGRIGYGKAYYDRYFQRFPGAVKAGICFESQLVEQIPMEAHDHPMDYLVTEKGIR